MKIITTDVAAGRYFDETAAVWKEEPDRESGLVTIYPEKQYQSEEHLRRRPVTRGLL